MAFSWSCAAVRLDGDGLVFQPGARIAASEAPEINGFWMRIAGLDPEPEEIRGFAERYGFLRHEGEGVALWQDVIGGLAEMAAPWGKPGDPSLTEMLAPEPETKPELIAAREGGATPLSRRHHVIVVDVAPLGATTRSHTVETMYDFAFMQALDARQTLPSFRRCLWCKGWFAVGRSDQQYCLPKHRSLAHYHETKGR